MPSLLSLLCILLSLSSFNTSASASQANISEIDRHALLCFKSGISFDPFGILHSWSNGSLNFCSWKGVTCGKKIPPRVVSLDLTSARLGGRLSGCVGNLTSLSLMNLADNYLPGTIPGELGKLPNLHTLNLAGSNLEGNIPDSLGTSNSLSYVNLANNSLTGGIPVSLANSVSLSTLILSRNNLSGEIPSILFVNSSKLTLSLRGNVLNGSLPISIVNLSRRLEYLSLGPNQISGSIPVEIGNLVNLFSLGMESNFLYGSIPSSIGKLRNLYILNLSKNKLSGQIPPSIGDVTQLALLYLDGNNLGGNIPGSLAQCMGLFELNLSQNNLDGSIPVRLFADLLFAWSLDFSHNNLTGELPPVLGTYGIGSGLVSLHMEGNRFHGQIPERWHLLVSTRQINLSHNDLSGVVPKFFEQLDKLEQLDLSYNNLEGAVPASGIFTHSAAVVLDGNKGLCSNSPRLALPICPGISGSATKVKHHLSLLVTSLLIVLPPLTIGSLVLIWFMLTIWKKGSFPFSRWDLVSKMFPNRREVHTAPCHDEKKLKRVSYEDIVKATNWFSLVHTISSTCTGSVYVGRFKSDKSLVAIKVFKLNEPGGYDSYLIECEVLRSTRHRNIMRPVTLCSTLDSQNHEFKALIFELMVNGSLEAWLHSEQHNGIPDKVLGFGQRICIAADVASALDYAHNELTPPLIHCDLKPNNVLLDDDMTARLSDFGSAKFLSPGLVIPKSLDDVGGTIGYVAPEYGMGCEISVAGDVYSFGVLLLELLTGKRPTDDMFVDGLSLCKFCESMFPDRVAEILDPHMAHEEHQGCTEAWMQRYIVPLVALGLSCTMESTKDRPGMKDVCAKLSDIRASFLELS
ncbi:probable LRR receptor-like serine/threonine-protein kinase At3g47570 isoform X4 [Aegilops tauschii subsp. strangulata]|uniref:probable LRR receptor-like serine/threonine-protein kinase At3g47570 isoform X4 n=1 Tax=Aegilops tauschii subsp. strangulata TaxID=200361 RepID=UPI003CC8C5A1